jgi:hypothetical protein
MYVPTPPPPSKSWERRGDGYSAILKYHSGNTTTVEIMSSITKQEYFKLKLAGETESALSEIWEKWRKDFRETYLTY